MGSLQLCTPVGSDLVLYNSPATMSKLLISSCIAVAATLASAEPGHLVPALYNAYPNWPGVSTPYSSSTCYGCRPGYLHKRSADADAEPGYLAYGYGLRPYAYGYGLRPLVPGVAGHPGAATSFVARSPQGVGKRSADADPGYLAYGLRPYAYGVGLGLPYNGAVHGISQLHPTGYSHQSVIRGKRSADADADAYYGYGYPYGYAHRGYYGYGGYGY